MLGDVLRTGLPITFGPSGGVIGSLAGTVLNVAGRAVSHTESSLVGIGLDEQAICQRAIYAEAAFQSILAIDKGILQEEGFIDSMRSVANKLMPAVQRVGPKLLDVVKDDVIQMLVSQLSAGKTKPYAPTEGFARSAGVAMRKLHKLQNVHTNTGEESFMAHVASGAESGEEGLFDIIGIAAKLIPTAIGGIADLIGTLTESSIVEDSDTSGALNGVLERAVLAEAALQTAISFHHDFLEEEGFFDTFKDVVRTIGGAVVKHGPGVMKAVAPVVGDLVQQFAGENAQAGPSPLPVRPRGLSKKPSRSWSDVVQAASRPGENVLVIY